MYSFINIDIIQFFNYGISDFKKELSMKKLTALTLSAIFCLAATGCADRPGAQKTLEKNLYTDISLGNYDPLAQFQHPLLCDENLRNTRFSAKSPEGKKVSGVVCNQPFFNNIALD